MFIISSKPYPPGWAILHQGEEHLAVNPRFASSIQGGKGKRKRKTGRLPISFLSETSLRERAAPKVKRANVYSSKLFVWHLNEAAERPHFYSSSINWINLAASASV
ncbi:hypothetical protein CDAR_569561 [Caerostris darwini]|uniref:Uncharacterized protein n=1 Tax=Caerostris darwini TaxID=1538125 RepID=A0AAV4RX77_9ARAC|nr:hypothetical protein CDAR_569561 [Caerostris darwini]